MKNHLLIWNGCFGRELRFGLVASLRSFFVVGLTLCVDSAAGGFRNLNRLFTCTQEYFNNAFSKDGDPFVF